MREEAERDERLRGEESPAAVESAREPIPSPVVSPRIVISKGQRRLVLYAGEKVLRTYRIALGRHPTGDKTREGDGRTPEGEYYLTHKNRDSKYYLSLGLSYPNAGDAARGLADGVITQTQHDAIVGAIERKERPPWDTALGGEVFIHGGGATRDWTVGCIALDDEGIRELFEAIEVGTPVIIEP